MKREIPAMLIAAALIWGLTACGDENAWDGAAAQSAELQKTGLPVYQGNRIHTLPSETERNPQLETLIRNTWGISANTQGNICYYYNETDLNDDGTDEILAVVDGMDACGTEGDSALIAERAADGSLTLEQTIYMVREPIIVCDSVTNGWHDLIVEKATADGVFEYCVLKADDSGSYPGSAEDGRPLYHLGAVAGTAMIYNDFAKERQSGTALLLG
jgi:hypothetical protein